MFLSAAKDTRRGIILLIVLALLTLFAIVGVSFVMYAGSMATSARNAREAETQIQPDMDPELLFSWWLSKFIFDEDDVHGVYSAMRGHSIARTMLGQDSEFIPPPAGSPPGTPPTWRTKPTNTVHYNGIGRLYFPSSIPAANERNLVNYTYFESLGDPLRDPERYFDAANTATWRPKPTSPYPPNSYVPFNASYTYPDLNNMFLGAVKAGQLTFQTGTPPQTYTFPPGVVLQPSFHRPWLFGSLTHNQITTPPDPFYNQNWSNREGKYRILRPRPIDHGMDATGNPLFPYPEDEGGDVRNRLGSPGTLYRDVVDGTYKIANNDSIWMDLGAPVMVNADGTKYKPLFAPLIVDLDNRVNLNVHGNIRQRNNTANASNQGWGPWEVNIGHVYRDPLNPAVTTGVLDQADAGAVGGFEWTNTFRRLVSPTRTGRYGRAGDALYPQLFPNGYPVAQLYASQFATPGTAPHYYAPVDLDGCDEKNALAKSGNFDPAYPISRPSATNGWSVSTWPTPPAGYEWRDNSVERRNHPMLFNFFNPQRYKDPTSGAVSYDSVFPISNMEAVLRYGETNSPGLTSELYRICGNNFDPNVAGAANAARRRNLVTTHSFGFDRAGVTPWMWDPNGASPAQRPYGLFLDTLTQEYTLLQGANTVDAGGNPEGFGPVAFPPLSARGSGAVPPGSDFRRQDWRSVSAGMQRVDLNRHLVPYPIDPAMPKPFDVTDPLIRAQFEKAQLDRQIFAKDIYQALIAATGAYNPLYPTAPPKIWELRAMRWLAQLAVNIVDHIDVDDILTPFEWVRGPLGEFTNFANMLPLDPALQDEVPTNYVFGTELPRVVVNEAYAQFKYEDTTGTNKKNLHVSVWAELHNPSLPGNTNLTGDSLAADPHAGRVHLHWPGQQQGNYRVILAKPDFSVSNAPEYPHMRRSDNTLGTPWQLKATDPPNGLIYQPPLVTGIQHCIVDKFIATQAARFIDPAIDGAVNGGGYSDGSKTNRGFYVVGPQTVAFPGDTNTQVYPKIMQGSDAMTYKVTVNQDDTPEKPHRFMVVLARLANPYLPHMPVAGIGDSGSGPYPNPYVTVDWLDTYYLPVSQNPIHNGTTTPPNLGSHWSVGRAQPFGAYYTHLKKQAPTPHPNAEVKATFHRHNGIDRQPPLTMTAANTLQVAFGFDWLYHLDRQLSSPMELFNVSAFKPHELLQQFRRTNRNEHLVPWFDQTTRLYRAFEFLHTNSRASGVAVGGRLAGQINLNTVWDEEILQALCDAQPGANFFTPDDVRLTFERMMLLRSGGAPVPFLPGVNDRPFLSMGAGYSMGDGANLVNGTPAPLGTGIDEQHPPAGQPGSRGTGINDTFFRSAYQQNGTPLADVTGPDGGWGKKIAPKYPRLFHTARPLGFDAEVDMGTSQFPYFQSQMMTKMFNNVTTRSNVFAVWVTVGFFRVVDDKTRPVKLGAEIGKAEGRHKRHRFFTIVDRTNLTVRVDPPDVPGGPPVYRPGEPPIFLSGSIHRPETTTDPNAPPPLFTVSGAEYGVDTDGVTPILAGSYEGLPWKIRRGTTLVFGYGNDPAGQATEMIVTVKQVFDYNAVTGAPPGFSINVPGDPTPYPMPRTTPFLIAMTDRQGQPLILGNPGPQSRFNPRDYPWIVRHMSIIQ